MDDSSKVAAAAIVTVAAGVGIYYLLSEGDESSLYKDARVAPRTPRSSKREARKTKEVFEPRNYCSPQSFSESVAKRMDSAKEGIFALDPKVQAIRRALEKNSVQNKKFSMKQLALAYDSFQKHCTICGIGRTCNDNESVNIGGQETSLETFSKLLEMVNITDPLVQRSIFSAWSGNNQADGKTTMDFSQFFCTLAIMTKGTKVEKLKFVFRAYDMDGDGFVSRSEVARMIRASSMATHGKAIEEKEVQKQVNLIFSALDKNQNNLLSENEFIDGLTDSFGKNIFNDFELSTDLFEEFGMKMCTAVGT
eukprot:g5457.t1